MFARSTLLTFLLLLTLCWPKTVLSGNANEPLPPRSILIHLDGVSAYHLQQELEAGNLPNIEAIFYPEGAIRNAVTYLPSKTPMVIGSVLEGLSIQESENVSWSGVNRETGEEFTGPATFREMMRNKSRISIISLLHGAPVLYPLNTLAFENIPDLIREYRVLQYYWYVVDTYAHFYGEGPYLEKLREFDNQLGRLVRRLDDDVNIIIYADHGMAFGEGYQTDVEIRELIPDKVTTVSYPNIYLEEPELAPDLARTVLEETNVDFTFYRAGETAAVGYHRDGTLFIDEHEGQFRYRYEGRDPLGYNEIGYDGSYLTEQEWLQLTYDSEYPVAPPHIFNLLTNSSSGDILTFLEEGSYSQTGYSREGNHGGFTNRELGIPILLRGPDTTLLYNRETLHLYDLFREIQTIDFDYRPSRSRHYLESWFHLSSGQETIRFSISPYYRWAAGSELNFSSLRLDEPDHATGWIKYDLFRSYLARIWVGSGASYARGNGWSPKAFVRHEFTVRRVTARSTLSTTRNHSFAIDVRIAGPVSIQVVNFNSAGVRIQF